MNDLIKIAKECPSLNITIQAGELLEMAQYCIYETKKQIEQQLSEEATEKYISPQKVAELLECDLSTIWRHDKRGYLKPVYFGAKKRYRYSDIRKILEG